MKVVDLSAWQEYVDWQGLKNEGIEGVILKIGERNYMDAMFVEHVNHAVEYGFKYGIYYFFVVHMVQNSFNVVGNGKSVCFSGLCHNVADV